MKKIVINLLSIAAMVVMAGGYAFGQDTRENDGASLHAKMGSHHAKKDSAADFRKFRRGANQQIMRNDMKIDQLKSRNRGDKDAREIYSSDVLALAAKNAAMKAVIDGSEVTETKNWVTFKREFTDQMDTLQLAIKDMSDRTN